MTTHLAARTSPYDTPSAVGADDSGIYWSSFDNQVRKIAKTGGDVSEIGTTTLAASSFGLTETEVVIGDVRGVRILRKDGSGVKTLELGSAISWLIIDGGQGFASMAASDGGLFLDVISFDLDGGSRVLADSQPDALEVVVDGVTVYWGASVNGGDGGVFRRVPIEGGVFQELGTYPLPIGAVAASVGKLYFATFPNGPDSPTQSLFQYDVATGTTTELARGLYGVTQVVVAPEGIYWSEAVRRIGRIVPVP